MSNFTVAAIKATFLKLLDEKPISKITVKELCDECGINRNSFYYHFSDLPSLLEEILLEQTELIMEQEPDSIYDCLLIAIDFVANNKKAVLHIYNSANREAFERYLDRVLHKSVDPYIKRVAQGYSVSDEDLEVICTYYRCQIMGFVLDWLGSSMRYDPYSRMNRICELFSGSMEQALKRCSQKSDSKA